MTFLSSAFYSLKAQLVASTTAITANNTPVIRTCTLGSFGNAQISVPTEALTGDNILLNITLPATAVGCVKTVAITNSTNLNFVSSVTPFALSGVNSYTNAGAFDPINGQNFNVIYKFPNGKICDGASGTFNVVFTINCSGTVTTCTTSVSVTARAANYWAIKKVYKTGSLVCGNSYWDIQMTHNNLNSAGLGCYDISGNVTETVTSVPIISPSGPMNVNLSSSGNGTYSVGSVVLQNCQAAGSTITNTASYSFTLGNSCSIKTAVITATSLALQSPNASISFTKSAYANGGVFSNGCQGFYKISIYNNGNVPWTNFTLTDNLSIPGITVTSISLGGWTASPALTYTGLVTFTNPTLILNPGQGTYIYIYFNITGTSGNTVANTANLSYSGYVPFGGGTGGSSTACPGITCPTINTSPQNISSNYSFLISPAKAVPSITKCNEPNWWIVPIKQVGNTIKFKIQVGNSGAAPLNTIITDALSIPQNLTIISASPTYTYYTNQNSNYCGSISGVGVSGAPYVTLSGSATAPIFIITGLPGNCNLYKANILVIEFEATINPQVSGSKTNTAVATTTGSPTLSFNANYTIDKTGELKIRKVADVQTVENGSSFNYILTVTNMGSTRLDNVVVTDYLPPCVQRNAAVTVKKGMFSVLNTFASNVVVTINPAAFIDPGESFTITIPVTKLSGTNCCNNISTATAKMNPDNTMINATTPVNEPACVTSSTCCDILNFQTSLTATPTTVNPSLFNLYINAGAVPIQEIEVSMLDYHVEYSERDCKPLNMGIFGNIFSSNPSVGGLDIINNNIQSVEWGLGVPTILNNNISLSISRPFLRRLSCCNGVMYFCLKIRVKDINCKVCEKIVCGKFSLKSNLNPSPLTGDPIDFDLIRPEMIELYQKTVLEQQQQLEIEETKIIELINNELKQLEPAKVQEFLIRLNTNPKQTIEELRARNSKPARSISNPISNERD